MLCNNNTNNNNDNNNTMSYYDIIYSILYHVTLRHTHEDVRPELLAILAQREGEGLEVLPGLRPQGRVRRRRRGRARAGGATHSTQGVTANSTNREPGFQRV